MKCILKELNIPNSRDLFYPERLIKKLLKLYEVSQTKKTLSKHLIQKIPTKISASRKKSGYYFQDP